MTPEQREILEGYIKFLGLGTITHSRYAETCSSQAVGLEQLLSRIPVSKEVYRELVQLRVEIVNVQASIHTLGLTTGLAALAQLAAAGLDVPDTPPMPEGEEPEGVRTH